MRALIPFHSGIFNAILLPLTALSTLPSVHAGDTNSPIVIVDDQPQFWDSLTPYGDFRFRYENDWGSVNSSGIPRDDRQRLRIRGRAGLKFQASDTLTFDVRGRTGDSDSQQSPHLTIHDFDGGESNDFDGILDKYYGQFDNGHIKVWGGRNSFPFWKQNELFWDDDATLTGSALSVSDEALGGTITGTAGAFYLPDGGWELNGQMYAGQVVYQREIAGLKLAAAEGLFFLDGSDRAENLRNGNGSRDYAVLANQIELQRDVLSVPVAVGLDVYLNLKNYSTIDPDPYTAANADEDFGSVLSLRVGRLKQAGDIQFGYSYAWLEALAVNGSYAQDDWVRWGSSTQTDSSDLKGHEFRLTYRVAAKLDIMARLYAVDAISSEQDGMRFRVDFNYTF